MKTVKLEEAVETAANTIIGQGINPSNSAQVLETLQEVAVFMAEVKTLIEEYDATISTLKNSKPKK